MPPASSSVTPGHTTRSLAPSHRSSYLAVPPLALFSADSLSTEAISEQSLQLPVPPLTGGTARGRSS